jgi:hypothetical protein
VIAVHAIAAMRGGMMREAFQRAFDQAKSAAAAPHLESPTIQLLQSAAVGDPNRTSELSAPGLAKMVYAARALGGRWCWFVNGMGHNGHLRNRLRNDWSLLRAKVIAASSRQRIQVLAAMVEAMDWWNAASVSR